MTRLVRDLEDGGLVVRRENPASAREVLAELTPDGRAALARGHEIAQDVHDRMLQGLDDDERGALRALLHRVIDNLA